MYNIVDVNDGSILVCVIIVPISVVEELAIAAETLSSECC